jgi:hypothetical protein
MFPLVVLAATVLSVLAAAIGLSVTVVASLRGGRSTAAARRLTPLTITPALAASLLSSLALGGQLSTATAGFRPPPGRGPDMALQVTPLLLVAAGIGCTGLHLLVAIAAFTFAGRPREVARHLARLSPLPTLAALVVLVGQMVAGPVALLLGLGLLALAALLPPALALAGALDAHAVES